MKLIGHAAVFNSWSGDLGGFRERVAPGAFRRALSSDQPVFAVHHHNMADLLGSTGSQTLMLMEDSQGLYFELNLPETSLGRDVHELVRRGDLAKMSFSFRVNGTGGESWRETAKGQIERTLTDVKLLEISTVASPAYKSTRVSARSANGQATPAVNSARARMTRRLATAHLRVV